MKKSTVKPREYKYTEVKSVQLNTTVDVYGVVKFLKQPFKTRGKDYCMVVSLMDQTCGEDEKLKCLLFNNEPAKLPELNIGDIVRFHRLKISMFNNEEQGQSGPGFSWLVFSSNKDASIDPTSSLSPNYTFTDSDKQKIEDLRTWIADKDELVVKCKTAKLENIIPQMYFDFVCQVVSTCYFENDHCLVLRVWDGTVTIYQLRKFEFDEELLPSCDQELLKKADGFMVDIALYDDHCNKAKEHIKPGDFIKLINLHAAVYKTANRVSTDIPTIELILHRGNSFGRGCVSADDKILEEHLQSISNLTRTITSEKSNKNKKTERISNEHPERVIDNSQKPSTSKYNNQTFSVGPVKISELKRPKPFAELLNNSGNNDNIDAVTSTSIDEQKSYKESKQKSCRENDIENQLMEVDVHDQREKVNSSENFSSSGSRCMQQTVTVILGHPLVKVSKIKDVLHGDVPYKYRIMGHIEDYFPHAKTASGFLKLHCKTCKYLCPIPEKGRSDSLSLQKKNGGISFYFCPKCEEGKYLPKSEKSRRSDSILEYIYMFRMKVTDETGSLIVILCTSEAITFFRDVEPIDLLSKESLWHEIHDELDQLCSLDRPLFECCIKSYRVGQQTKHQIFDTCLV